MVFVDSGKVTVPCLSAVTTASLLTLIRFDVLVGFSKSVTQGVIVMLAPESNSHDWSVSHSLSSNDAVLWISTSGLTSSAVC